MHLVNTNESKVLVDVGTKPTVNKNEVQPFFNAPELLPLDNIDAVVLTHAHVDLAMLPVCSDMAIAVPFIALLPQGI